MEFIENSEISDWVIFYGASFFGRTPETSGEVEENAIISHVVRNYEGVSPPSVKLHTGYRSRLAGKG